MIYRSFAPRPRRGLKRALARAGDGPLPGVPHAAYHFEQVWLAWLMQWRHTSGSKSRGNRGVPHAAVGVGAARPVVVHCVGFGLQGGGAHGATALGRVYSPLAPLADAQTYFLLGRAQRVTP